METVGETLGLLVGERLGFLVNIANAMEGNNNTSKRRILKDFEGLMCPNLVQDEVHLKFAKSSQGICTEISDSKQIMEYYN